MTDNGYEKEITLMKQANINFLRTSHYPDREYLYELSDRWGIYVMDDLEGAGHPYEIQRGRFVNLNIDLNIHGAGGVDTWGQRTLPQYTIDGNQTHHYAFILEWK